MPRSHSEKCRLCSKISVEEAMQKDCWHGQRCHNRRSYYKHRAHRNTERNGQRRAKEIVNQRSNAEVADPVALLYIYRNTAESPIHAIKAELWQGRNRIAKSKPQHCLGVTGKGFRLVCNDILAEFSQECGKSLDRFQQPIELHPSQCSIRPCPLHPDEHEPEES